MKRLFCCFFILLLFLSGCASKPTEISIDVLQATGPSATPGKTPVTSAETGFGIKPRLEIISSVAYVYEGSKGRVLYGALEYENTGDCPIHIGNASFTFSAANGKQYTESFTPPLSDYDVVMPGERSYIAAWFQTETFAAGADLSLHAELNCLRSEASRQAIAVDDIFLADNYPSFTTMTGRLTNNRKSISSLNMVYAGFYDASGELLCVWYFTKNAQLEEGDDIRFVTHMREMPFQDLAERTAEVRATAFGF